MRVLERGAFDQLLGALDRRGYEIVGPTVRQGAIVLEAIETADDLPIGWTDEQEGGTYRLHRRDDDALFGYAVGAHSWKQFLHPPVLRLWRGRRAEAGEAWEISADGGEPPSRAFLGVRSCDLHAISSLDDALWTQAAHPDPRYRAARGPVFVVAVNCAVAGGTCFCVSMQTGPRARSGFDLALTELLDGDGHRFTIEAGSDRGREVLAELDTREASPRDVGESEQVSERTAASMGRELDTDDLKGLLYRNLEHPRWDEVSERCLTCGNCTMVCPTCFCTSIDDTTDLAGLETERWQRWDSCFNTEFSYVHGGSIRGSPRSRYRQWMTHKLATWHDQFGAASAGCVGCGRCITWCPVAIDITEEAAAIRASDGAGG